MWEDDWHRDNILLRTTGNMMLYEEAMNDDRKRKMSRGLYLVPEDITKSQNTSSMYAYVQVFEDPYNLDDDDPIDEGWISLSSDNFVVDNY